jgi:hypothetical protein
VVEEAFLKTNLIRSHKVIICEMAYSWHAR